MAKKKEKKAGKRMKKKELVKVLLEFFHTKQDEVLSLKYIFEQLHLTTHPLKMLCMDILSELSMDDYITEVDKHKPSSARATARIPLYRKVEANRYSWPNATRHTP